MVRLACKGGCPEVRVVDYITAKGTKAHKQLFKVSDVEVVECN